MQYRIREADTESSSREYKFNYATSELYSRATLCNKLNNCTKYGNCTEITGQSTRKDHHVNITELQNY